MDNSIQKQLEDRRRRMEANRPSDGEPMDVDTPFANNRHQIEQEIVSLSSREHELQTELHAAQNALVTNRARLGVLRTADRRPSQPESAAPGQSRDGRAPASEAPNASAPSAELTQEEKDYEIALMLQRQMEREIADEERAEREAAQPQPTGFGHDSGGGSGGGFSFSFSRSSGNGPGQTFTFSSTDPNAQARLEQLMRGGGGGLDPLGVDSLMGRGGFGFGQPSPFGSQSSFDDDFGMGFFGPRGPVMPDAHRRVGRFGISPFMFGPVGPFGIGGLNIDLDNMDHDQILRLQEMIGNVPRGASTQEISELPTSEYHAPPEADESKNDLNDERRKCSICLEQFAEGEEIRTLPCFHIFHADEIDKWLQQNSACPICRQPIQSRDEADVPPS